MKPQEIEDLSFRIIEDEAGNHGFTETQWPIARRIIHASADFEYVQSLRFHPDAIENGIAAIRSGNPVFTDTNMARSGMRKMDVSAFGGSITCLMADPEVAQRAKAEGITKAKAAVEAVEDRLNGAIYVVGNAPTALLRLLELVREKRIRPALIMGFPVGFVNAAESKAELLETPGVPYITNVGRKGGSSVAAAAFNALAIMATAGKGA